VYQLIAILGRGIQQLFKDGPWVLTEDLETCDERSAHLPVRAPVNDEDPHCLIGGGEMNLAAGACLVEKYRPLIAVCAYGGRSAYLESINAPSESEVMSTELRRALRANARTNIIVWNRDRQLPVPANTRQELLNIFDLAVEYKVPKIALVTVGVHVPRTAAYVAKHLSVYPQYRELSPVVLESEEVLLGLSRNHYAPCVEVMRNSKAFARNWAREADGISKIIRDVYGDTKPKVVA
jgi:hypothetical protein